MQMQMSGSITDGDGIAPFAACDRTHQLVGALNNNAPILRFLRSKVDWTTTVSTRIKQTPTGQWGRTRMVSQQPEIIASDLMSRQLSLIAMQGTDGAGGFG